MNRPETGKTTMVKKSRRQSGKAEAFGNGNDNPPAHP